MRESDGFEILINGVPRTFRDRRQDAHEAALYLKSKARNDVVEIVDRATGVKVMMLEDGRTA